MKSQIVRAFSLLLIAGVLSGVGFVSASGNFAYCKESRKKAPAVDPFAPLPMVSALKLPKTASGLTLDLQHVDFVLVHEKRDDIELRVNYPKHWAVDDSGSIKQTEVARCYPGYYCTQNGHTMIGMGTVSASESKGTSIQMTSHGFVINGKKMPVEKKISRPGQVGMEMNTEGIFIDGHRLRTGSTEKDGARELDCVQLAVPEDYQGTLAINWQGVLGGKLDNWSGGALTVNATGSGELNIGELSSNCSLSADNRGKLAIGKLVAKTGNDSSATAKSEATIKIGELAGTALKVESKDKSEITLGKGELASLEAQSSGESKISAGETSGELNLHIADVKIKLADKSHLDTYESRIDHLSYFAAGSATARIHGDVAETTEPSGSSGGLTLVRSYRQSGTVQ